VDVKKVCRHAHPVTLLWTDRLEVFTSDANDFILVWYEQRAHATLHTAKFSGKLVCYSSLKNCYIMNHSEDCS